MVRQRREIPAKSINWLTKFGMDEDRKSAMSIYSRASLVPAAAVIPAQVVYTDVVAVKKLVVDGQARGVDPDRPSFCCCLLLFFLSKKRQQAAAKRVVFWHYSVLNISRKLG